MVRRGWRLGVCVSLGGAGEGVRTGWDIGRRKMGYAYLKMRTVEGEGDGFTREGSIIVSCELWVVGCDGSGYDVVPS